MPRLNSRVIAVYGVGLSFIVMSTSGLMLLLAPQGRLARQIDWSLLGLGRTGWEAVHNATAFAFMALGLWHIVIHWPVIRNFLVGSPGHPATHRPEAAAMLILIALLIATAILNLPPASWLVDLNEFFKREYWASAL